MFPLKVQGRSKKFWDAPTQWASPSHRIRVPPAPPVAIHHEAVMAQGTNQETKSTVYVQDGRSDGRSPWSLRRFHQVISLLHHFPSEHQATEWGKTHEKAFCFPDDIHWSTNNYSTWNIQHLKIVFPKRILELFIITKWCQVSSPELPCGSSRFKKMVHFPDSPCNCPRSAMILSRTELIELPETVAP